MRGQRCRSYPKSFKAQGVDERTQHGASIESAHRSSGNAQQRLNHELAVLRCHRFAHTQQAAQCRQPYLLDEMIEPELEAARPAAAKRELRQRPRRAPLPTELPRTLILQEPDNSQLCLRLLTQAHRRRR